MTDDCIFCRIARGELGTPFVAESEYNVAFRDLAPQAPTHVLVAPRQHFARLQDAASQRADIVADALTLAIEVARREGLLESGYRVVANDGPDAGQTVHHLHFHVLGGAKLLVGLG